MKSVHSFSKRWFNTVMMAAMIFIMAGLLMVLVKTPPPQTVIFDIEQTLDSYQDKLIEAGLNDDDHRKRLAAFDRQLRRILNEYAQAHNLILVVPGAVISGAPDMTTMLQRHVIEEMKAHQPKE